jgi:hypothetical protein
MFRAVGPDCFGGVRVRLAWNFQHSVFILERRRGSPMPLLNS